MEEEAQEDLMEEEEEEEEEHDEDDVPSSSLKAPFRASTRMQIQRSNVCSRAYFVVVMVFFHVYIVNVIGLLLYVHYNNGPGDVVSGDGAKPEVSTSGASREELHMEEDYSQSFSLPRIEGIRVGHVQQVSLVPDRTHEMRTLSLKPLLFGLLTLDDFRHVYDQSQRPGQQRSGKPRSHFKQRNKHTRLHQGPGSHHVLQTLRNRLISLTRLPSSLVELSEPLQVIRYKHGDFGDAHHDSGASRSETTCAHSRLAGNSSALTEVSCRYLTVLFYLSSVEEGGETTFPVADNRTYEEQALVQDGVDLTDTQQTCVRGNMRIKPAAGTALLWYNHLSDGRGWMGELDEYSLHGDCPVSRGMKWTANSWVNVDPDHQQQARYQRLVAQRHRVKSGMEEHYQPLSHSDLLHQDL
ncbi:transmembrane prolyl 4-hydroxylase-like isoform X2 [Anarrhichthys ocellatus]|uniref:transmembrane prolyl 4-hydroxylase-like isoform X2 n=1 Tax=Anarrhichthys ocellatus TaxID=433405 RepID=UPI0012ECD0A8|nr:transmembrane prolyl 4-hydroxylase-like isoform X2 [Anarrhichthys ocellatus]